MLAALIAAVTAVVAAVLSLASAAYVARAARRTGKEIEVLRAELASDMAEQESRRDYELAARRRIYDEAEPLILKLAASCDFTAERIIELADPRRWPQLEAVRDSSFWMLSRSSQVIATARALLEPLAVYTLLSEKLTLVDTSLDSRISEIYTLARAAYGVHLDDYQIAAIPPALTYDPVVPGWREKRARNPATYWWQGMTRGRLDPAIELYPPRRRPLDDCGRVRGPVPGDIRLT